MLSHQHSGRLRAHHHTSYASLFFVMALTLVLVMGMSWSALAAPPAENPLSGGVGLTGVVRGPAPTTAAVIATPTNGSSTTTLPVTVSGTCPTGTFVTVNKNNVFAGAASCQSDGTFSMLIDLFEGTNVVVARVSDALGQFGPDSNAVNITYNSPSSGEFGGIGRQLFLNMTTTVVAGDPGTQIIRTAEIIGGVAPYAISWEWGDNATTLASMANPGTINGSHVYDKAGTYRVVLRVTDSVGNSAYLQFVTIVNGPAAQIGRSNSSGLGGLPGQLVAVWPVAGLAFMMVLAFWLGERREISKLRQRGNVL